MPSSLRRSGAPEFENEVQNWMSFLLRFVESMFAYEHMSLL
jgi:hypothetical protein